MSDLINTHASTFVDQLLATWNEANEEPFGKKAWKTITSAMVFAGKTDLAKTDKKQLVLDLLGMVLDRTDSPGPDLIVDSFIKMAADHGIDALYSAFKGEFNFDGDAS